MTECLSLYTTISSSWPSRRKTIISIFSVQTNFSILIFCVFILNNGEVRSKEDLWTVGVCMCAKGKYGLDDTWSPVRHVSIYYSVFMC